jgi:NADH:ubiquinone oxidoreductase subunit 4 (subunit M)
VFLGTSKDEAGAEEGHKDAAEHVKEESHKIVDVPNYMKVSLAILVVLVVLIGIYPTFFMNLIQTVTFGGVS